MRIQSSSGLVAAVVSIALAGTATASEVYVPLGEDNRILVIDTKIDAVVRQIVDVPNAHGLAATTDGKVLVAGSLNERAASASGPKAPPGVSARDHMVRHSDPRRRAQTPDAYISTVSIFRKSNGEITRHIDVPGAVHHVAVSPDNRFAAVTHPGEGTITLIDLGSYRLIRTIATGLGPNFAIFDPTSEHLYVSNAGDGTISDIEIGAWIVRRSMPVGKSPEHIVLSPNGSTLYVNNVNDGTVSALSLASGEVVRTIPVGDYTHSLDLSEDGETLYISDRGNDRLCAIDLRSAIKRGVSLNSSPFHVAVLRGEGKLYVTSADEPKIWVVDQNTLQVKGEILIDGRGHQMIVLPSS